MKYTFNDKSKIDQITKDFLNGFIPLWIKNSNEVDETLIIYLKQLSEFLLSNLEKSKLTLLKNLYTNIPDSFLIGFFLNNILDFKETKNILWNEDTPRKYKIYLIERFMELIRKKGTSEVINILISRAGLFLKKVEVYAQNRITKEIKSESDIIEEEGWKKIWYSNWDYREYDPLAKYRIILEVLENIEFPYFYLPFQDIFDLERAINKLSAYYEDFLGVTIIVPFNLKPIPRAIISNNQLLEIDFGKMLNSVNEIKILPDLNHYIFYKNNNINSVVYNSDDIFDENNNVILERGNLCSTRRVTSILDCPIEQLNLPEYPTYIKNNDFTIELGWGDPLNYVSLTLQKSDGKIIDVSGNWSNIKNYKVRLILGNETTSNSKIIKKDKVIPRFVDDNINPIQVTRSFTIL